MTTAAQLLERASQLIPVLRSRANEADLMGHLHDETVRDFIDLELLKALTPRRYGGLEYSWDLTSRIIQTIASGCGSAGWVINAYLCTTWVVATFPAETQQEIFGDKGYTVGPCPMNALLGRARKVSGGYQVTLKAPFGSGVYHSQWAVVCATVEPDESAGSGVPPQMLVMLVPRSDFSFDLSSWAVLGMRGTGSATLVVKDAFVPDRRAMDLAKLNNGTMPGAIVNPAAIYRVPYIPAFIITTTSALVGMAAHGVEALKDNLGSTSYAMSGKPKSSSPAAQMRLGEATAYADAARALLDADAAMLLKQVVDDTLGIEQRTSIRLHAAYSALLCRQAMAVVKDTAGANALRDGSAIQRVFRDVSMGSGNFAFQLDDGQELYGRQRLGLPIDPQYI